MNIRQLTSEEVQTRYSEGRPYRVWMLPGRRRNEALDTAVYALAARQALPYRLDTPAPKPRMPTPPPPLTADEFVALAAKVAESAAAIASGNVASNAHAPARSGLRSQPIPGPILIASAWASALRVG